jgi:hypothetical protein
MGEVNQNHGGEIRHSEHQKQENIRKQSGKEIKEEKRKGRHT